MKFNFNMDETFYAFIIFLQILSLKHVEENLRCKNIYKSQQIEKEWCLL